ncbi:MAG: leucine-rich repeat protein [Clostridia bacterium]|nr:leucine-rich repeat protein [Clostridia bacterium]
MLNEQGAVLELYAIYKANTFTVVYNSNRPSNASTQITGSVSNTTHTYDTKQALNTSQKFSLIGYVQTSWNTQADGKGRTVGLTEEVFDLIDQGTINLYAIWRPVSYSVAYNHEGNVVSTSSFNYDTTYNLKTKDTLAINKQHHKFIGWAILPNSTEVVYEDGSEVLNLTDVDGGVVSLYAVWKVFSATVHGIEDQVVEVDANTSTGVVTITKANLATTLKYLGFEIGYLNTTPTISNGGYTFTDGTITISLTGDIDLYVCWKAVTYQIKYNLNEATASGTIPATQNVWAYQAGSNNTYTEGSGTNKITLANRGNITCPTLTICGWAVKANSTVLDFDLGEQLVLTHDLLVEINEKQPLTSNVINLYGMWSDSYSISYDMNTTYNIIKGNKNNILGVNKVSTGSIKLHTEHTIPATDTDGKVWEIYDEANGVFAYFLGWAEESNATTPKYVGGEVVSTYISPTTLYAVWSRYTNPKYFTYNAGTITGFSDLGNQEIVNKSITNIIMPRFNPTTAEPITAVNKFASSAATGAVATIDFVFTNSLNSIADFAFENFNSLISIKNINSKIETIGNGAFATSSLSEITFAGDKKNYVVDEFSNVYYVSGSNYAIHTYLISNSSTNINIELSYNKAINGTNYVLTEILPYAFYKTNIETLIYTNATNLAKIGIGALKQTSALKEIKLPFIGGSTTENNYMGYVFGETTATGTSVPATLKTITIVNHGEVPNNAFKGFANVQKIVIGSLTTIGKNAFQGCTNLKVLNADGSDTFNIDNVTTIGDYAFEGSKTLPTNFVFTENTTTLGAYAFANTNIEYVYIPRNVISIAGTSFYGSALKSARLYSTSAFKAVYNNTNIKPTANNNGSVIYTDVNFYLVLTQVTNSSTYLSYTIVVDDMIAVFESISDNTPDLYNNIYEAISSAKSNSIIMIKLDIAVQTTITVNKNLTILAGHNNIPESDEAYSYFGGEVRDITLTRATGFTGNIFNIVDANVTIGSAFNKEGYESSMLYLTGTKTAVVSSLIMVQQTGYLTLEEKVTLQDNLAESGGAVYVAGELFVENAQFVTNQAQTKGGAIYINDAKLTIIGSVEYQFLRNIAENGGAIYVNGNSMLNIKGAKFVGNYATLGGTIYFNSSNSTNASVISAATMEAHDVMTSVADNPATRGGIIYQNSGLLKLTGKATIGMSGAYYGGVVAVYGGKFILDDATISEGNAYYGGGIYIAGTTSILEINDANASVSENTALKGANIYFASTNATASTISNGSITYGNGIYSDGQVANLGSTGGGIFVVSGKLNISGNTEISNNKGVTGGGLQVAGGTVNISGNATISNNTSLESGAGIYHINATLTINGATITQNYSNAEAAGIFTGSGNLNITGGAKITNNTATTTAGGIKICGTANVSFATGDANTVNDISGNTATNSAGIVVAGSSTASPTANISNTTILGNVANGDGGGLTIGYANLTINATTVITENTAKHGAGIYVNQGYHIIENATISANTSTYGAIYVSENAYLTLNSVTVESNNFENLTDNEITNGEDIKGIYVKNTAENAFTISNNSKIVDTIYLTTGAIVNIADAFNINNGHTSIKIAMQEVYTDEAIRVGKYAMGVNADANKFTSDADLIFVEQGQDILIVKGVVLNSTINKKYGSLESAINSVNVATENVIMLLEDIYIDSTLTIPANRNITIIGDVKSGTQGYGLFRKEGFKDLMFVVNGTLNLNQTSTTTTLTVTGLKLANTANKTMFAVNGTLNMNQNVVLTGNGTSTNNGATTTVYNKYGGAIYVASNGTFNMNGGEIYGNSAQEYGGAIYVTSGTLNIKAGTIGKYDGTNYLGNTIINSLGSAIYASGSSSVNIGDNASATSVLITGNGSTSGANSVIQIGGTSVLKMYNTILSHNKVGANGLVDLQSTATQTQIIERCDFVDNVYSSQSTAAAVSAWRGTVNIKGKLSDGFVGAGILATNYSTATVNIDNVNIVDAYYAIAAQGSGAKLNITNSTVGANGKENEYGIYIAQSSAASITNTKVEYNNYGIYVSHTSTITMTGGTIANNSNVGVSYNSTSTTASVLSGVTINKNENGGVLITNGVLTLAAIADASAIPTQVTENEKFGITANGGTLNLVQAKVDSNRITSGNAALKVNAGATVNVTNGSISSNTLTGATEGNAIYVAGTLNLGGTLTVSNATTCATLYVQGTLNLKGQVDIKDKVKLHDNTYKINVTEMLINNAGNDNIVDIVLSSSHIKDDVVVSYATGVTPQKEFFDVDLETGYSLKVVGLNIVLKEQVIKEFDKTTKALVATYGDIYDAIEEGKEGNLLLVNTDSVILTATVTFTKNFTLSAKLDSAITRDIGFTSDMFKVNAGKTVIMGNDPNFTSVYNSQGIGNLIITGNSGSTSKVIYNNGTLTLTDYVHITAEQSTANLIYSVANSVLNFAGVEIHDNNMSTNMIGLSSTTFTMSAGRIYDNQTTSGDIINISGGVSTFSGGVIGNEEVTTVATSTDYSNKAAHDFIQVYNSGEIILSGTILSYNYSYYGMHTYSAKKIEFKDNAIMKYNSGHYIFYVGSYTTTFNMSGGQIFGNNSRLYVDSTTFNMSGGQIYGNVTDNSYNHMIELSSATFNMSGGTIGGGDITIKGALKAYNSNVNMSGNASISNNKFSYDELIVVNDSSTTPNTTYSFVMSDNASISGNSYTGSANYIYPIRVYNGKFEMSGSSSILNNTHVKAAVGVTWMGIGSSYKISTANIISGTISGNTNISDGASYSVEVQSYSPGNAYGSLTLGNGISTSLVSSLVIANPVYLSNGTHIYVNGNYNENTPVIPVIPAVTDDNTIIATYINGATPSELLFKDPSEELTYTLDGQNVIIGKRNVYNATTGKYYTDLQRAVDKVDTDEDLNELYVLENLTIEETVNIINVGTDILIACWDGSIGLVRHPDFTGNMFNIVGSTVAFNDGANELFITSEYGYGDSLFYIASSDVSFLTDTNICANYSSTEGSGIYAYDSTITLSYAYMYDLESDYSGSAIYISGGTLNISNCDISYNISYGYGGAIYTYDTVVNITNSLICYNTAESGSGALDLNSGTVNISGGSTYISNNYSYGAGGAIGVYGTTVNISDATINSNTADGTNGGAIYISSGTVNMASGYIQMNSAYYGGGVYVSSGTFNLKGGYVGATNTNQYSTSANCVSNGGNTASYGGGVYVDSGTITSTTNTASYIRGNYATYGAGVYLNSAWSTATSYNSQILNGIKYNYAGAQGGGIYNTTNTLTLSAGTLSYNQAANAGGGVYSTGPVVISGSTISYNTTTASGSDGAGLFITGSSAYLTMSGGTVSYNTCKDDGGGIYLSGCTTTSTISGTATITRNTGYYWGGGIRSTSPLTVSGGTISYNTISGTSTNYSGGGISCDGTLIISGGVINNNSAPNGGGIAVGGTTTISGGQIKSNSATYNGGGIWSSGTLNLNGGQIGTSTTVYAAAASAQSAGGNIATNGGGVYVSSGSITNNSSGTVYIRGNHASGGDGAGGGGIYSNVAITISTSANRYLLENTKYNYTSGEGGALFINASFTFSTGTISYNQAYDDGGAVSVRGSGTATFSGGTISNNKALNAAGGGVYVTGSVKISIAGTTFSSNTATNSYGGAFYTSSSNTSSVMSSGSMVGNSAAYGGAFGINGGTFTLSGGIIGDYNTNTTYSNTATVDGGGVYIRSGTFVLGGGDVRHNSAAGGGGGIFLNAGTLSNTSNSYVNYNKATGKGGGLYLNGGTFSQGSNGTSAQVNYNSSGNDGGGIYSKINITANFSVSSNSAVWGGGILIYSGTLTLGSSSAINYNTSTSEGGGIYVYNTASCALNGGTINGNSNGSLGGGVYYGTSSTTGTIGGSTIHNNSAGAGGGVFVDKGKLTMNSGIIGSYDYNSYATSSNNSNSAGEGGGVYARYGEFRFYGGQIRGNYASTNGGGICSWPNSNVAHVGGNWPRIFYNTANYGGGMYGTNDTMWIEANYDIAYNRAAYNGGGIYSNGAVTLPYGYIGINSAGSDGGGVYCAAGTTTIAGALIYTNSSTWGGGVYVANGSYLNMSSGQIYDNSASSGGGGVCLGNSDGYFTFSGGMIGSNTGTAASSYSDSSNRTSGNGGGVYIGLGSWMRISNAYVYRNYSGNNGGGIYIAHSGSEYGKMYVSGASYAYYNRSVYDGSGVYISTYNNKSMKVDRENSAVMYVANNYCGHYGAVCVYYGYGVAGYTTNIFDGWGTFSVSSNNGASGNSSKFYSYY